MPRITTLLLLFFWIFQISAQDEVRLPADLRQHNLTTYNSSLFNPTFSLDRNDPESVAFWTRWQWQSIDADPTTLFLNYSRRLNQNSGAGVGFFQHNTGIFFNTGGVVNYAYQIQFSESVRLSMGFNLFGFKQELADTRFQNDPNLPIPLPGTTNDFILQWAPGASISVERMTLSMASENLLDYNFRAKEANTPAADKIFMGMMSYDFPLSLGSQNALLRPSLYLRTIPQQENQIGILSLLRTAKYWAQLGYNNFYGVGVGAGGTFFKRFNLGAVFEFGTSASINSKDPSFEFVASYFLGKPDERDVTAVYEEGINEEVVMNEEVDDNEKIEEELKKAEEMANEEEPKEEVQDEPEAEKVEPAEEEVDVPQELEIEEPRQENQIGEEVSKKDQRKIEKEAAAEEKRLKKEQDRIAKEEKDKLDQEAKEKERLAKEEQAKIAQELKEAKAKEAAEAKVAQQQREAAERADAQKSAMQKRQDSIAQVQRVAQEAAQQAASKKRMDSLNAVRKAQAEAEARALELQRKQDSIAQAKAVVVEAEQKEEVKPEAGEKYEEVQTEDGLEPGFYLIANVFGTKKYFDAFMADLTKRGLSPKSFLRSKNNYNYAYLARFDTMAEARRARDSKFNGQYTDKTWVFRVVGK